MVRIGNDGLLTRVALVAVLILCTALVARQAAAKSTPDVEELKKRQATIKGLVVRELDNGKRTGMAIGIVATAEGSSTRGSVNIRGTIGKDMISAVEEAERYVRVQHPTLGGSNIVLSFEERYAPKDGGSAGTAFAVLLRSLAEGFEIDRDLSITGDVAVNGKVQPIGGVTAKLRGSREDGCKVVVIPKANTPAVADLLVTADKCQILQDLQILSVETVDDAVAAARVDRAEKLAEAMRQYDYVQTALRARKIGALKEPRVSAALKQALEQAPNHVSARYAMDISQNKGPRTLTRRGSLEEIFATAAPVSQAMNETKGKVTREQLPHATCKTIEKDLTNLKRITHPEVDDVRKTVFDWVDSIDRVLSATRPISQSDAQIIEARRQALIKAIDRLGTDEALVAKMMREGY
jgi:hypothetical protein